MTRGEIQSSGLRRARQLMKGTPNEGDLTPGFDDPFTLDEWVNDVTFSLFLSGTLLYLSFKRDIVSGQKGYSLPTFDDLYEATIAISGDSDAQTQHLSIVTPQQMLSLDPTWRTTTDDSGVGTPLYLVQEGEAMELWPVPDYDKAQGLTTYGTGFLRASSWSGKNDECPILEDFHPTVAKGVALKIASPVTAAWKVLRNEFVREVGFFESQNRSKTEALRSHSAVTGRGLLSYGDNPLNMW